VRYAIFSDVHADAIALRAVLADMRDAGAETLICLGDVLGYGPDAVETLQLVHDRVHVCLAGNHDDAVCRRCSTENFRAYAADAVTRQRRELAQSALDWLRHLPYLCAYPDFACAHGAFADPKAFEYAFDEATIHPSFAVRRETILFTGHTHIPGVWTLAPDGTLTETPPADFTCRPGCRYLVNVGSVGYPRADPHRSTYCLYDDATGCVTFRTFAFDFAGYAARLRAKGAEPAPWMRDCLNGVPNDVRAAARFAAPEKTKKAVFRPPSPAPAAPQTPPRRPIGPALVLAALLLALGGIYCARLLVQGLPDAADKTAVAEARVATVPEARPAATDFPGEARPLPGGWTAILQEPSEQRVEIVRNAKKNVTAFRLTHTALHTARLTRTLSLFDRPSALFCEVKRLTRDAPGKKATFGFSLEIVYRDAQGGLVFRETCGSGVISKKYRSHPPPGAESAELRVDICCHGTYEMAVPHFAAR